MPTASGREGGEGCLSFPGLLTNCLSALCARSVPGLLTHAWAADLPAVPQGLTTQQPKGVFSGAAPWAQGFSVLPSVVSVGRGCYCQTLRVSEKKSHTRFQKGWATVPAFHIVAWVTVDNSFAPFQKHVLPPPSPKNCAWLVGMQEKQDDLCFEDVSIIGHCEEGQKVPISLQGLLAQPQVV